MSAYLYPSTSAHRAHPFANFFEDNDLFQAFNNGASSGCRRGGFEDPFSHAIRLAQIEEEARRQHVVAKARARAQAEAEAAEARRVYQLRLEQEERRRQAALYQQRQIALARAEAERQRRVELAAQEEANFINALQQHIFGGAQQQLQRQRALEQEQRRRQAQAEAEAAHRRQLQAREQEAERRRQSSFDLQDVFGPQFFEQTFENFLAPFLSSLMQQGSKEEETAATHTTATDKGKAVDKSSPDAQESLAPAPKTSSTESTVPVQDKATAQQTVRSVPIESSPVVNKAPSPPASDAGSSTRGRSRSPKRARVSDVDEEGNEVAIAAQEEEEDYVQLSEAGSEH